MKLKKKITIAILIFSIISSMFCSGNKEIFAINKESEFSDFLKNQVFLYYSIKEDNGTYKVEFKEENDNMPLNKIVATLANFASEKEKNFNLDEQVTVKSNGGETLTMTELEWLNSMLNWCNTSAKSYNNLAKESGDHDAEVFWGQLNTLKDNYNAWLEDSTTEKELSDVIADLQETAEEGEEIYSEIHGINKDDDSDIGGILLKPLIIFFTFIADGIQSIVTRCVMGEWRDVIVGENVAENLSGTEAFKGKFKGLKIWASDEKENIAGWPKNIDTSSYTSDEEDDDDGEDNGNNEIELSGNEYFINTTGYSNSYGYPQIFYSPEEIFAGKIDILNVNFFSNKNTDTTHLKIQNIVKQWFRSLRYIGLAALLSILIYIGIKVMISSAAADKSKYKTGILNWVQGIAIMFLLPYIMSFILTMSDNVTKIFSASSKNSITVYAYDGDTSRNHTDKLKYTKFKTNLMGLVRFQVGSKNAFKEISYAAMYIMLVIYTVKFTFMYIRRMIYMAFLTLISPFVAVMYPINGIRDGGKKITFNIWIKEYTFNALIQPIHILIYYILVTSAIAFASSNPIYVIVVLGFMSRAEQIIKKIFGLDKPPMGTVRGMSDSAANMITYSNILNTAKNVKKLASSGGKDRNTKNDKNKENAELKTGNWIERFANMNSNRNLDETENTDRNTGRDSNTRSLNGSQDENQDGTNGTDQSEESEQSRNANYSQHNKNDEDDNKDSGSGDGQESNSNQEAQYTSQLTGNNETQDKNRTIDSLREMSNKRISLLKAKRIRNKNKPIKQRIKGVAKEVGKGALKGTKYTAMTMAGLGAVGIEAAVSIAANGRYSFKEGAAAFSAAAMGTKKAANKVGKKAQSLNKEYNETKYGKEQTAEKQREAAFWKNEKALKQYQNVYGQMGAAKLENELERASKLAKAGIENVDDQMQVMAFADHLTDERFNAEWNDSKFTNEEDKRMQMAQKADELRKTGGKGLEGLTDEDVIKADIRNQAKYDKLAEDTYFVKQRIPSNIRKGTKKEQDNFIRMNTDTVTEAQGMKEAIKYANRMEVSQYEKKARLEHQREEYRKLQNSRKR